MSVTRTNFLGLPAVERQIQTKPLCFWAVDFLAYGQDHHVACALPAEYVAAYRDALSDVLRTYRAGTGKPATTGR